MAAVLTSLVGTAALIVQATSLAAMLAALFHEAHAALAHEMTIFVAASLVRALTAGLAEPLTSRIAAPVRRDLRRRALALALRDGPFDSVDATVQLCTRGIDAIEAYLAKYVPALILAALAPSVLLVWLAANDLWSAVIVAVGVALLPVFMVLLGLEAKDKMQQRWRELQRLASYFGDVVRGMTVLKSYNRSLDAVANLNEVETSLRRTTMSTLRVAFMSSFALELLSSLATALVALVLGLRLLNGSLGLNVALAVLLLTPEVFLPLRRSAAQYHASSDAIAAATDLLVELERPLRGGASSSPDTAPTIEVRDLDLSRVGQRGVRSERLSCTFHAGTLTTVTGSSGSGKSTLLRIIAGLRESGSGVVVVDGVDLSSMSLDQWQRRVVWLAQDPSLPGETVRDAVQMGDISIDDETINETMRMIGLSLDLDRPLGEGSRELSAGQRRRLAMVRAMVRRPLVLLLDEPTAHLDADSAALVERAIDALTMTRIVATHRPFDAEHSVSLSDGVRHGV
jgi:ATP-binding cassette subfamily C protein CydCD